MVTITMSSLDLDYVRVPSYAKEAGVQVNPVSYPVQMAFTSGEPASGDWKTASWETDATVSPTAYYSRCLVGPSGTVELAKGKYFIWVRVTATTERPVRKVGILLVT